MTFKSELDPRLLGVTGLNSFAANNSASRLYMQSGHLSQNLVTEVTESKAVNSGVEIEYGKYTFKVIAPCDMEVIEILTTFNSSVIESGIITQNPETIVIYRDIDNDSFGILRLHKFCSNHPNYGFLYKPTPELDDLRVGSTFSKGTIFLDSPNIKENGEYGYGNNVNVALMTHPAVADDGILVSKSYIKKLGFHKIETRIIECGTRDIPLNIYGDELNYKCFPDVGKRVRSDGILMALRKKDNKLDTSSTKSVQALMEINTNTDTLFYNEPDSEVINVKILRQYKQNNSERTTDEQLLWYYNQKLKFSLSVDKLYKRLKKQYGDNLILSPELQRFMVECYPTIDQVHKINKRSVQHLHKQEPIDTWRIEITTMVKVEVHKGNKITDAHGGKGVLVKILDDADMPRDELGNVADVVMDPNSTIGRMNLGRLYEGYMGAVTRDLTVRLKKEFNINKKLPKQVIEEIIDNADSVKVENAINTILELHKTVNPQIYEYICKDADLKDLLISALYSKVSILFPTNNYRDSISVVKDIMNNPRLRPIEGPLTFRGYNGQIKQTKENISIMYMYFILLDKTPDEWSAVSSARAHHFGVLASLNNGNKYSAPYRCQPVRHAGETEVRIFESYVGERYTVDMLDRNNNPSVHRVIVDNILSAKNPFNYNEIVDRKIHKFGANRAVQLTKHILSCSGIKIVYKEPDPIKNMKGVSL